jgi:ribonucleoside-diphosphate reductase alpha chain
MEIREMVKVLPIVNYGIDDENAYSQGFYSGDGVKNTKTIWLYNGKVELSNILKGKKVGQQYTTSTGALRQNFNLDFKPRDKNYVPINDYSIKSRLDWFSGILDSDGTLTTDKGLQIVSIDREFLINIQHLLTTLGINSKVVFADKEGFRTLPDGKGGNKEYFCKETSRILIGAYQVKELIQLGLKTYRINLKNISPNRDAQRFVTVTRIELQEELEDFVYCFDEPKEHKGTFNGILTGQCVEISLRPFTFCNLTEINAGDIESEEDFFKRCEIAAFFGTLQAGITDFHYLRDIWIKNTKKDALIGVGITGI